MLKRFAVWLLGSIAYIGAVMISAQWSTSQPALIRFLVLFAIIVSSALILVMAHNALTKKPEVDDLVQEAQDLQKKIDEARVVQDQARLANLEHVLQSLGIVGPREILEARAIEMVFPFVDLTRVKLDQEALNSIPLELMTKYRILPIKVAGNQVWIASANVHDNDAIDEIRSATGLKANPCMCETEVLERLLKEKFGSDR